MSQLQNKECNKITVFSDVLSKTQSQSIWWNMTGTYAVGNVMNRLLRKKNPSGVREEICKIVSVAE